MKLCAVKPLLKAAHLSITDSWNMHEGSDESGIGVGTGTDSWSGHGQIIIFS